MDEEMIISDWLFKGWQSIGRVLVVGVLSYCGMLLILRISGKRTLSKMNPFDLVVTVALGSILSTTIVSRQSGVADGLTAVALLVLLQYIVAWLTIRSSGFHHFINGEPTLLFHQGDYLKRVMRRHRVSEDDILASIRDSGISSTASVTAVILETDGSVTVIRNRKGKEVTSLKNVQR
ncbi:DUF421 domain-containing protein [Spirosoma terrae]|uniref:DUF421 domain-containing protein n=2 Tax=Spirosoma terrae TaxID=1968276 RepID=A0A6L9LB65_9BACT|nr:DUF421 domain-containing protein [Spirosoma terrae]